MASATSVAAIGNWVERSSAATRMLSNSSSVTPPRALTSVIAESKERNERLTSSDIIFAAMPTPVRAAPTATAVLFAAAVAFLESSSIVDFSPSRM